MRTVLRPAERALRANLERRIGEAALKGREQRFSALSLEGLQSLQLILHYVDEIAFGNSARIARFSIEEPSRVATIDAATRRNLELVETRIDGEKKHSLLGHLNFARTAMGSRLLTEYLLNPSADREEILRRHDAVQELVDDPANLASLRQALCSVRDIDRIVSRVTGGRAVPKRSGATSRVAERGAYSSRSTRTNKINRPEIPQHRFG